MPRIIQLLGQARSGKDWTAEQLKTYFESQGKSVEVMSYAAPMKRIAATLFGISLEQLDEYKNNSERFKINLIDYTNGEHGFDTNFREFLQRLGNDTIKPIFGDDVWAKLAKAHISKSKADIVIMSDCRFSVELNEIGGTTVRIVNNSLPPPMNHSSEHELLHVSTNAELNNTNHSISSIDIANLGKRILNETIS
jgi:hypothetical protein